MGNNGARSLDVLVPAYPPAGTKGAPESSSGSSTTKLHYASTDGYDGTHASDSKRQSGVADAFAAPGAQGMAGFETDFVAWLSWVDQPE